jgi:SAM-dependent methyltransferase
MNMADPAAAAAAPAADASGAWWRAVAPSAIPTKQHLHRSFVALLEPPAEKWATERYNTAELADGRHGGGTAPARAAAGLRVLDAGCGDGRVALGLAAGGCRVVGVDVNAGAVAAGNEAATAAAAAAGAEGGSAEFMAGDCCTAVGLAHTLGERAAGGFGVALAQLLISVVGGPAERAALLAALHSQLQPGGTLMLSASAVSDDINPEYAEAYRRGLVETGEQHTYYSRDERGAALYRTHHFTFEELSALVRGAGFVLVSMNKEREVSSRRSDQAAWFLYVVAAKADVPYRAPPAADASGL